MGRRTARQLCWAMRPQGQRRPCLHPHAEAAPGQVQPRQQMELDTMHGPAAPEAINNGQLNYPQKPEPERLLDLSARSGSTQTPLLTASIPGDWAKIGAGMNSMGFGWRLDRNAHDIGCDRGLHYTWQLFIRASNSGETCTNYFMNRVRCTDGSKRPFASPSGSSAAGRRAWRSDLFTRCSEPAL